MNGDAGRGGEPRPVAVHLAGSTFTIRTDASQDYIERLQTYVNGKLEEVHPSGRRLSARNALALAALSIADDYFSAAESRDELDRVVRDRLKGVLLRVDEALSGEDSKAPEESDPKPR